MQFRQARRIGIVSTQRNEIFSSWVRIVKRSDAHSQHDSSHGNKQRVKNFQIPVDLLLNPSLASLKRVRGHWAFGQSERPSMRIVFCVPWSYMHTHTHTHTHGKAHKRVFRLLVSNDSFSHNGSQVSGIKPFCTRILVTQDLITPMPHTNISISNLTALTLKTSPNPACCGRIKR